MHIYFCTAKMKWMVIKRSILRKRVRMQEDKKKSLLDFKSSWRWMLTQSSKSYRESINYPTQDHGHLRWHGSHCEARTRGGISDSKRCLPTGVATSSISVMSWTSSALPQWISRFPQDPGEMAPAAFNWLPRIVLLSLFRAQRQKVNGIQSHFSWFDEWKKLIRLAGPAAISSHAALNSVPIGAMSSTYILS